MTKLLNLVSAGALLVGVGGVNAATITFTDSIATQSTNWLDVELTVSQFDGSLGTLTAVEIVLIGSVSGTANAESLDAAPANLTLDLRGDIELDLTSLSVANILLVDVGDTGAPSVSAFVGDIDFAGASGVSMDLSGSDTDSASTTDVGDLAFFTGGGTVSFLASATGKSSGTGAGNLITQFQTQAGAEMRVTYTYDEAPPPPPPPGTVPTPAPLALMALGLIGIAGFARRSRVA